MPEKNHNFFGTAETLTKIEVKKETPIEKLKWLMESMSLELRKKGWPIDARGKINIDDFKGVYSCSDREVDKEEVREMKEIFKRAALQGKDWLCGAEERKKQFLKKKTCGEAFEMLVVAALHKNLPENFVVVRGSDYDDIKNKIDTFIFDRNTGEIVCAVNEFVNIPGAPKLEEKRKKILDQNLVKKGSRIKYGIFSEKKKQKTELKRGRVDDVPIFLFTRPEKEVKERLDEISCSQESSPYEKELFGYFIGSVLKQAEALLREDRLDLKLKKSLEALINSFSVLDTIEKVELGSLRV